MQISHGSPLVSLTECMAYCVRSAYMPDSDATAGVHHVS